jgi:hypothetical protein
MASIYGHAGYGGHGHGHTRGHGRGHMHGHVESPRYRKNYDTGTQRSALLEDFRLNRMNKNWELDVGHWFQLCMIRSDAADAG